MTATTVLYPNLNDVDHFSRKIAEKREFFDTQYDGTITNVEERANELANAPFELSPHQVFVRNFLSAYTPYNGLLLFHGLGSGKTCSAIGVCEEHRTYNKAMDLPSSKIYVVASPFVQDNFRLQLFNKSRLRISKKGECSYDGCVGNSLLREINPGGLPYTGTPAEIRAHVEREINKIIRASYVFMGYEKFSNLIEDKVAHSAYFNNRLIVIDEIHNIRKQNSTIAANLLRMLQGSQNIKLLLLTATPMFNSYLEIIWLLNLLNANDKRGILTAGSIFNDDGSFKEGGRELLVRKMTGYVSYVRGENPYTFPFRIYPDLFAPENTFPFIPYPRVKPNGAIIRHPLIHLYPYLTNVGGEQMKVYRRIIDETLRSGRQLYSLNNIARCIQCLIIAYPETTRTRKLDFRDADTDDDMTDEENDVDGNADRHDNEDTDVEEGEFNPADNEEVVEQDEEFDRNYVRKYVKKTKKGAQNTLPVSRQLGLLGLNAVMDYTSTATTIKDFDYKPGAPRIFSLPQLAEYSGKMAAICQQLSGDELHDENQGIILIYSKYLYAGIVPMALALEELGFHNASTRGDLLKRDVAAGHGGRGRGGYVMITGNPKLTPNLNIVNQINERANFKGEKIKVVLISDSGSEGIDLQNIRQIHVLDPWFNLNRIEQIIGRGVRNLSHRLLPFIQRNVQIFLHGAMLTDRPEEESMDLYQYRLAQRKATQNGRIARILKETAVDCVLNHGQTNFSMENFRDQPVTIQLSDGQIIHDFRMGDRPFTFTCDYMDTCDYECAGSSSTLIKEQNVNNATYNTHFSTTNTARIIDDVLHLFRDDAFFYLKSDLVAYLNMRRIPPFPVKLIDLALSQIIEQNMTLHDKYGRTGSLINIGEYYLFQPREIDVVHLSIADRSMKLRVNYNVIPFKNVGARSATDTPPNVAVAASAVAGIMDKAPNVAEGATILTNLHRQYKRIHFLAQQHGETKNKKAKKEDFTMFGEVLAFMFATSTELENGMKLVLHHLFDMLPSATDKLALLRYLNADKTLSALDFDVRQEIDKSLFLAELLLYIQNQIFTHRGSQYVYYITNPVLKKEETIIIPGTYYRLARQKDATWEEVPDTMNDALDEVRREHFRIDSARLTIDERRLNTLVGFIGFHNDKSNMVFKTKDVSKIKRQSAVEQATLKGTNCFQAIPQNIIRDLQSVAAASSGAVVYDVANLPKKTKEWYCILLELTLRKLEETHVGERVWFVSTADAVDFKF